MSQITTHVINIVDGLPARNLPVVLWLHEETGCRKVGSGVTDADGRIDNLCPAGVILPEGTYRMRFDTGIYFKSCGKNAFYPWVDVIFNLSSDDHYHMPLLLSAFGYSTYRGY